MSRSVLLVVVAVGTALLVGGAGCSNVAGADESDPPVATVDSIEAPSRIAPSDTLTVRLRGTVGPNGCYSLDRVDVRRAAGRLTLTPLVDRVRGGDVACTMAIVPLDETMRFDPPFEEGALTITVPQPDQADVTATVEVTAGDG
jgi:hypothetical protein